jgi:protein-disulfide isomerase/uncharacterized membrane protein
LDFGWQGGGRVKKRFLIAAAAFCIIGAITALVSTSQYFRIQKEGFEQKSFCAVSELIDCDITSASSYATFMHVPIAWMGFLTYLLIGGMSVFAALSPVKRKGTAVVAWFFAIFSVLYSAWMAYILFFILKVICIECVTMYVINIIVMIMLRLAVGISFIKLKDFFADYLRAIFGKPNNLGFAPKLFNHAIVVALTFGLGWIIMFSKVNAEGLHDKIPTHEKIKAHYIQSLHEIPIDPSWPVWGNPNSKITIVEFSDFECPFCRLAALNIRPYLHEFKDKIRYYFVHYPLDKSCNTYMEFPMHQKACMAAEAAVCAQKYGDFWGFHDELFRMRKNLSRENILKEAGKRGWDVKEFEACLDSPETKQFVQKNIDAGHKIYIRGTPSLFLNGRKLRYWRDPDFLQGVIKEEIKRSKKS